MFITRHEITGNSATARNYPNELIRLKSLMIGVTKRIIFNIIKVFLVLNK